MSKREVDEKFDEIVDFAGVVDFIDVPVKRYSSGMFVRLGFSVAAHLDPEVLLLDEVLAVGDVAFQQKCLKRIDELTQSGRTVLFVSHTPGAVAQLCHRAIVINEGRIIFDGDVDAALDAYLGSPQLAGGASATEQETSHREGTGEVRVTGLRVVPLSDDGIVPNRPLAVEVDLAASRPDQTAHGLSIDIGIWSATNGQPVTLSTRYEADDPLRALPLDEPLTLVCEVDELPLRPGRYSVAVTVARTPELLDSCRHQTEFTLHPADFYNSGFIPLETHPSPTLVRQRWRIARTTAAGEAAAGVAADGR
jgi:lipopolysaccharide transport system ATP-binding protein